MTWEKVLEILLDSLKDSVLIFAFVFLFHVILSFIETPVSNFLIKRKKTSPIFGALFGLIPQCGTSVVAADLYIKQLITFGTLIAVFLSCSDEALLVLLSAWNEKSLAIFPLIGLKLAAGIIFGFLIDLIIRKQTINEVDHVEEEKECHTHHHENTPAHAHLIHPLIHAIKIFVYVFVINLALGLLIGWVGEENFTNFMISNKYLAPLFTSIIGLIPNCASSVLITELYLSNTLSFGALFAGLLVNSGLGVMILFKEHKNLKKTFVIIGVCFAIAVSLGYLTCLISGF
ncbi:MAG: arsenic efflux protein [Bacilli bacterium]|nr:arsenic efflux protein [Bacilli bacterium]